MASLGIMIFSWTPWLQSSTTVEFNVGYFFICMNLGKIIGATLYEFIVITLKINHYLSMLTLLAAQSMFFLEIFLIENLFIRLMLICLLEVNSFSKQFLNIEFIKNHNKYIRLIIIDSFQFLSDKT